MRKNILPLLSAILLAAPAAAQEKAKRIVEPVPAVKMDNFYRVGADRTPVSYTHLTLPTKA